MRPALRSAVLFVAALATQTACYTGLRNCDKDGSCSDPFPVDDPQPAENPEGEIGFTITLSQFAAEQEGKTAFVAINKYDQIWCGVAQIADGIAVFSTSEPVLATDEAYGVDFFVDDDGDGNYDVVVDAGYIDFAQSESSWSSYFDAGAGESASASFQVSEPENLLEPPWFSCN